MWGDLSKAQGTFEAGGFGLPLGPLKLMGFELTEMNYKQLCHLFPFQNKRFNKSFNIGAFNLAACMKIRLKY